MPQEAGSATLIVYKDYNADTTFLQVSSNLFFQET